VKTIPPPSFKQRMSRGFRAAAVHGRLCKPERAGNAASILAYHSVVDGPLRRFVDPARRLAPESFDRHCAWLARNRKVLSLTALVQCLRSGGRPEPGTVVITFDGGYRDNLHTAAPILARYRLPATLFLPTDSIEAGSPHWGDRLYTAFRMRRRKELELRGRCFDLSKRGEELAAYQSLTSMLMVCDGRVREERLDDIEHHLGAAVRLPRLTLDWNEVRAMLDRSPAWELGIQGAAALDLSSHTEDAICDDLARAINMMDRRIGEVPRHFAFPYGRSSEVARGLVVEMGLQSAVAASTDPLLRRGADIFGMTRIGASQPLVQLAFLTAGGWQALPARRERAA
jgi:peptidoglycan/xylan/chitin deacetylase (PgdA/CDA1 family)